MFASKLSKKVIEPSIVEWLVRVVVATGELVRTNFRAAGEYSNALW
jgi:hypothetical protein